MTTSAYHAWDLDGHMLIIVERNGETIDIIETSLNLQSSVDDLNKALANAISINT
jgi:hypothetical protein